MVGEVGDSLITGNLPVTNALGSIGSNADTWTVAPASSSYGSEQRTSRRDTQSSLWNEWAACLYSRSPFTKKPLLLFRRVPNLCVAYRHVSTMWAVYQGSPKIMRVTTHWIGSPKRLTRRGFGILLGSWRRESRSSSRHWWRSSTHSDTALIHWDMSPGIWKAALADGTWLGRPCHPRRFSTRCGENKSLTYRLKSSGEFIPPWATPARMQRQVDVAVWKDSSNVRLCR